MTLVRKFSLIYNCFMENYDPAKIESKWQKVWEEKQLYKAVDPPSAIRQRRIRGGVDSEKPKKYILVEFPYPSGEGLHVGHARTYITFDIFARKKRMEGFNVLYPMGWDAFGLPTENYALRTGMHPRLVTEQNTKKFKKQMDQLALAYNWDREVNTTDPSYYRWTQWIFLQLFKHGLAYKKKLKINWCPACKIGLANEEVADGKCERCGTRVGQKVLSQWLLRITKYADRLADELDLVDFPTSVVASQRNWIGRSKGVEIKFPIGVTPVKGLPLKEIPVFTTRPDTLFGVTFFVLAPEHPILKNSKFKIPNSKKKEVFNYIKGAAQKSELERIAEIKEKTGVFTGLYVLNPLSGEKIPVWVADFVLMSYGTGAVMGVPAHDQRDWDFAKKHNLEVREVISRDGQLVNSGKYNSLHSKEAIAKITEDLEKQGLGKTDIQYHLRDWIFSRQHYWGEPIPMVYCEKCGWQPVPEEDLPVELPKVEQYEPTGTGESPLAAIKDWVETICPVCGGLAKRETDTMPNWAGSSWYFLRYCDPANNKSLAEMKKLKYWMPVDVYFGGAEHTTLHLLYSRFWHKFLNDIGVAPGKEPYSERRVHGVILGEDGQRMSKSKGNVITQKEVIESFGVDSLRIFSMFMGPYDGTFPWSTTGIKGTKKFLDRFWNYILAQIKEKHTESQKESKILIARLNKGVDEDIDNFKFNTAVAKFMSFLNEVEKKKICSEDLGKVLRVFAPFAPHITEELWQQLRCSRKNADINAEKRGRQISVNPRSHPSKSAFVSVHQQPWPKYDPKLIEEEEVTIIVQVNGKVREKLEVRSEDLGVSTQIERLARESVKVQKHLAGRKVKNIIFVPGRLINFVLDF